MQFYHFGVKADSIVLLLPGTCRHWKKNFGEVVPWLNQNFHVVCISYAFVWKGAVMK